jgi:hypothetical protein
MSMEFMCQICGVESGPQVVGSEKEIEKTVKAFANAHKHGSKKVVLS